MPYLFKFRHTAKVKALVIRMIQQGALWQDCGDGWQALETTLRRYLGGKWLPGLPPEAVLLSG